MRTRRYTAGRRGERGLTLLELMLTLAIVAVGILGLTSMNFQSARAVQDAAEISLATNLATAALDELQVADYNALVVGAVDGYPIYFDKFGRSLPSDAESYFRVAALVESESPQLGFKDVRVTVNWEDNALGGSTTFGPEHEVVVRGRVRQLARGN